MTRALRTIAIGVPLLAAILGGATVRAGDAERAELERDFANLEAALRATPSDRFDPQAVVELAGRDAEKLATWVRDHTTLLPYRGALRGPVGTLMDRGGSSLDRSLLLADLLRAIGHEVRLAAATLPADQAKQLLQAVVASADAPPRTAPAASDAQRPEAQHARQRVRTQVEQLMKLLGDSTFDAAAQDAAMMAALADHWWIQRKQPDSTWDDFDLDGLSATPTRTVELKSRGDALPLDASDCHEVELRIVIEAFSGGRLTSDVVLKQSLRPAEMIGRTMSFTHYAASGPLADADFNPDPASRRRLKAALLAQSSYIPVLRIDNRPHVEASFTTSGEVDRSPRLDPAGRLGGTAGSLFGGGLGALGGGGGGQEKPSGVLTAEWIEYEIRVPGQSPRIIRREVFDLLGPAARGAGVKDMPKFTDAQQLRRALLLVGQTQILLQPCDFTVDFALCQVARRNLKEKDVWLAIARGEVDTPAKRLRAIDRLAARDDIGLAFAVIRDGAHGLKPGRTFIDRPNIFHHRQWLEDRGSDGLTVRDGMDVAFNSTSALGQGAFAARLERGVADTLAEHLVLGSSATARENTVTVFEAATAAPSAVTVLRKHDDAAVATLTMQPDTLARVRSDLAAGNALVLGSAEPARWSWWRVDPRTGQAVGVMDNGFNSGASERTLTEAEVTQRVQGIMLRVKPSELAKMRDPSDFMKLAKGNMQVAKALEREAMQMAIKLGRFGDALAGTPIR